MKSLQEYTEQAISLLGGKVPGVVYIPPAIRKQSVRLTAKGVATKHPLSADEQLDRIVAADPLGFLIAIMNGQPVIAFRVGAKQAQKDEPGRANHGRRRVASAEQRIDTVQVDGNDIDIFLEYYVPTIPDRERVAIFLANLAKEIQPRGAGNKKARDRSKAADNDPNPDNSFDQLLNARAEDAEADEA